MGLRGEMEDGVDLVLSKHSLYICWKSDISLLEGKIRSSVEYTGVVQGCAIVQLVERDNVVVRVGKDEMANEPTSS